MVLIDDEDEVAWSSESVAGGIRASIMRECGYLQDTRSDIDKYRVAGSDGRCG